MKREFVLPEQDIMYLDSTGLPWETVKENGNWVIVHNYPIPDGYTLKNTSAALKIEGGYPSAQIDMVYFFPQIQRADGKIIGAVSTHSLDGKQWQRWSRHRTGQNPWRPGIDDISTHFALVQYWLEREFQLR